MVRITKDMPVAENPNLLIHSMEGDYADTDLIMCAEKADPSLAVAQMQAQYVKYGAIVYQHNTPEELGAALFALDPEATHDAVLLYKEDEARRIARSKGTLEPSEPVPATDSPAPAAIPEEEEDDVKFFREQAQQEASTTPEVVETPSEPAMPVIEADPPAEEIVPEPVIEPELAPIDTVSTTTPSLPEAAAPDLSVASPE